MDAEIGEARKGKTTLNERLEEDKTNILNTIGQVDITKDGDIASQLKNNKNNIEKAVQKKIESPKANLNTLFENGIHRCFNAQTGFPTGYTTENDFFLINYKLDGDVNPWLRQTLYDLRSSKIFTRQIYNGTLTTWKELATIDDTGWIDLPLIPPLVSYGDNVVPKYRKINNIVEVRGAIKGLKTINSNTGLDFSTLPVGFRPKHTIGVICQGSALSRWYLNVSSSGTLNIDRYSENGSTLKTEFNGLEWLPFQIMFGVD